MKTCNPSLKEIYMGLGTLFIESSYLGRNKKQCQIILIKTVENLRLMKVTLTCKIIKKIFRCIGYCIKYILMPISFGFIYI